MFLSELRQISTNFNKFWYVDGKVAETVRYVYIVHPTWPMSLHYFVKCRCSKFLLNTGFITIRLLRFSVKVKRAYCRDIFLLRGHCQTCARCPQTIFYVSTWWRPGASSTRHRRCPGAREMRETRRHLSACVRVWGTFWARILTILSPSVMTTNMLW